MKRRFASVSVWAHSRPPILGRAGRAQLRGFTLIELMVVVIIIAVVAVIAIPSIGLQLQDRRTRQAAQMVASFYTEARTRAMGRGAAVLVRFDTSAVPSGAMQIREAIRGAAAADVACQQLPVSSCLQPAWESPPAASNRLLTSFDPTIRGEFTGIQIQMQGPGAVGAVNAMDVCFTPLGSSYVRYATSGGWTRMSGVPVANVWRRNPDGSRRGLTRTVMILPSGAAHLGTAQP
jgi:prepilin-type N-terminal cleavage/methylation domain-containing protein